MREKTIYWFQIVYGLILIVGFAYLAGDETVRHQPFQVFIDFILVFAGVFFVTLGVLGLWEHFKGKFLNKVKDILEAAEKVSKAAHKLHGVDGDKLQAELHAHVLETVSEECAHDVLGHFTESHVPTQAEIDKIQKLFNQRTNYFLELTLDKNNHLNGVIQETPFDKRKAGGKKKK